MKPFPPVPILLLLSAGLAGCIFDDVDPATTTLDLPADLDQLIVLDHDHALRADHAGGFGTALVGFSDAGLASGVGSVNEIALWEDLAFVSRGMPEGGFAIIDLSASMADDTARDAAIQGLANDDGSRVAGGLDLAGTDGSEILGEWAGEPGFDIEVSDDGRYVFFATQRNAIPAGPEDPSRLDKDAPRGLLVFDVTDPTNIDFVSYYPMPWNGVHTVEYYHDPDTNDEILLIQTYDLTSSVIPSTFAGAPPVGLPFGAIGPTQRTTVATFEREATGGPTVEAHGTYQILNPDPDPTGPTLYIPHDAHAERHPITGQLLMYVAYWDAGLRIVDITDLADPQEIAAWTDFSPSSLAALHDAKTAPILIDGRHITVTAPEIVSADETGQFTIFDTSDPTSPEKLGHWALPGDGLIVPTNEPFLFSPHNFYIDQRGLMTLAHNHGGTWVVDLSNETLLEEPETVAYAFATEGLPDVSARGPSVWTAIWWGDKVVATDGPSGVYIYDVTAAPALAEETDVPTPTVDRPDAV